ncbi:hypothetical protein [Nonomuraea sp. NPDC049400]|uniref:hypothetical protein n=1 Tax=Nonomuraea sp. NPDC049400 TaxID=3364352 RepID=UPI00379C3EDD
MTRNSPDDATRRGTSDVEAIEGLLAYAQTGSRWGGAALRRARDAVARSRALAEESPEHTALLARSLRTMAALLLKRGRAVEALPVAQEAAALTRAMGGAPLVASLMRLAEVYEALHRYSEAAAAMAEADRIPPPEAP